MNKKIAVILPLLICMLAGCADKGGRGGLPNDESLSMEESLENKESTINDQEELDYKICKVPYALENGLSFSCIQVCDMKDEALEAQINNSLQRHFCMLKPSAFGPDNTIVCVPVIHMQTSRYLSVEYVFQTLKYIGYWHLCVTVDMQSGEEIFLDDLLEINEGLVRLVKDGGILKMDGGTYLTAEEATESENKFFSGETMEYVQNVLEFFTEENLYNDSYSDVYAIEQFFYLEEGAICFRAPNSEKRTKKGEIVRIMTDDVSEYLKVPAWGIWEQEDTGKIGKESETVEDIQSADIGYSIYGTPYMLDNGYSFISIQVCDMKDKALENKVNEGLNEYFYILEEPWFTEENIDLHKLIIHYQSSQYLSIEYIFDYLRDDTYDSYLHLCITVDMQSGEVVFLNDLIELDEAFAETVKTEGILKHDASFYYTAEEITKRENEYMADMGTGYILDFFEGLSREKLYGGEYYKQEDHAAPWGLYIYRTYFYLEEDAICCNTWGSGQHVYRIMLEDIEEHLKVPIW